MSALVLVGVTLGGAYATSALEHVSNPASVRTTAQRVDASRLLATGPDTRDMTVVVDAVNVERRQADLPPLTWQQQIAAAAGAHSTDMAQHGRMQHPGTDGSNAGDRLARQGFTWTGWGETIGAGYGDPAALVEAWMNSPGHRAILLGDFRLVGIAVVDASDGTPYWTLVAANGR